MTRSLAAATALALASCATMGVPPQPEPGRKPARDFSASITLVDDGGRCVLGDKTGDIRAHRSRHIVWQVYSDCASDRWIRFVNWQPARPPCIAPQQVNERIPAGGYGEFRRNVVGRARTSCTFDLEVCDGRTDDAACEQFDPRILIEN